ncbi:MAG TPA: hypothetical protein PLL88_01975 [Anaerolineaceae bacterium]|nr:hypothetical protein [Anaerolineaceae bacterium]
MNKINKHVISKLENDLGLSKRTIYRRILEKERDPKIYDKNLAALVFALENKVDIYPLLSDEEKAKIRAYYGSNPIPAIVDSSINIKKIKGGEKNTSIKIPLDFITNVDLKNILDRDIKELSLAQEQGIKETAKTCIILSGSILEAIILAALKTKQKEVNSYCKKTRENYNLDDLTLNELVKVASSISPPLLPPDIVPNIHQIRNWRNLIHPGRELSKAKKDRISPSEGRARTAIASLHLISEEINKNI